MPRHEAPATGLPVAHKALLISGLLNVALFAGHIVRGPLPSVPVSLPSDGAIAPRMVARGPSGTAADAPSATPESPVEDLAPGAATAAATTETQADRPAAARAAVPSAPGMPAADQLRVVSVSVERNIPTALATQLDRTMANVLAQEVSRLLVWKIRPTTDLRRGDRLEVAWTDDDDGGITIWATRFQSQRHGRTFDAYRWTYPGDAFPSWFDADGTEVPHRLRESPIEAYEQITSLLLDRPDHNGMDFMTPVGTPVMSPWAGEVTNVNWNQRFNGDCVEVTYADGLSAKFLHLSAVQVQVGQRIPAGQVVGLSGNTGRSTGPHLHYELRRGQQVVDPVTRHGTMQRSLPASEMDGFRAASQQWEAHLQAGAANL
jgi:murein DD-endopeptidase MepM/ murein hydrolase activator NlpD